MRSILQTQVYNPYRSKTPKGFYDPVKGHTGVDLAYVNEDIPAPCDLTILKNAVQNEMGNVIYAKDAKGYIHVFAHQKDFIYKEGDFVKSDAILGHSGNTGKKTTAPHLHYEVLAPTGTNPEMKRSGLLFKGDNVDPLRYLKELAENTPTVSEFAAIAVKKAIKKGIHQWDNPQQIVADVTSEQMLFKVGLLTTVTGKGVSKERFAVVLDRLGKLD